MKNLLSEGISKIKSTPKALLVLFYTETCELFGRFGITSVLVLYLTKQLHYSDAHAFVLFGAFISMIFITPILGGIISDKVFGASFSILFGSLLMGLGNIVLSLNQTNMVYLWPRFCSNR